MRPPTTILPYRQRNLLFLAEAQHELLRRGLDPDCLFRASEAEKLDRIIHYGTDRGGFAGREPWRDGPDRTIAHEDVIFATTAEEIRQGEADPARSTSLKKFALIEDPLLLAYDPAQLRRLGDRQYEFLHPDRKPAALLALFPVDKGPAIQGWFREDAGLMYRSLVAPIHGGAIVEVGCWKGLSTSYVGRLAAAQGTRLVCVDDWSGSSDDHDAAYRRLLAEEDVPAAFAANLRGLGIAPEVLQMPSVAAAARFAPGSLDLVFIDASHDEGAVRADLMAWRPKLRPGGVLAGHDYSQRHPGVVRAVDDLCGGAQVDPSGVWWLRC